MRVKFRTAAYTRTSRRLHDSCTGMGDENETCGICYDRPRAVRNLPCGHGGTCELCTIEQVQFGGLTCSNCRSTVSQLAVMPVTMATVAAGQVPRLERMPTYQAVLDGHTFESVEAFLHAKLDSDDAGVAEAAGAALALMSGQGGEEEEEEEEWTDEDEYSPVVVSEFYRRL